MGEYHPEDRRTPGRQARDEAVDPARARALGTVPTGHPASEEPSGFRGTPAGGDLQCRLCGAEFHAIDRLEEHRAQRHAGAGM